MRFESIENLIVRQKARTLTIELMDGIDNDSIDPIIEKVLIETTLSVMNTIAEAYEMATRKDLVAGLWSAKQKT